MNLNVYYVFYVHADVSSINLDDYNIHVIASVFKQWLRDLPNPLMTFELYEEFLRTVGELLCFFCDLCMFVIILPLFVFDLCW